MESVSEDTQESLDDLALHLDVVLNGDKTGSDRPVGFILAVFPFFDVKADGALGLLSNGDDASEVLPMLRKMVRRVERDMKKKSH